MSFELPALPYAMAALEPYISAKTMEFHYGKHHKAYIDNLNNLIKDTLYASMDLDDIIRSTVGKPEAAGIFNNAAQAWNHAFFWKSMRKRRRRTGRGAEGQNRTRFRIGGKVQRGI